MVERGIARFCVAGGDCHGKKGSSEPEFADLLDDGAADSGGVGGEGEVFLVLHGANNLADTGDGFGVRSTERKTFQVAHGKTLFSRAFVIPMASGAGEDPGFFEDSE